MAQKRQYRRRSRTDTRHPRGRQPKKVQERGAEAAVIRLLLEKQSPLTTREISMAVSGRRNLDGETKNCLDRLVQAQVVQKEGKKARKRGFFF